MSLDYNQVNAITEKYFLKRMADNVFDSNPLTKRAKKNFYRSFDGGEKIMMPLEYAELSASGWFSGADVLSTTDNSTITAAALDLKQMYANISINRREELQNSGKAQIISLVKSKMKTAEKTMMSKLGTGLWNAGSTTDAILGLRAWLAIDSDIAGIDQSSYSWWQSQLDSSTTVLSLAAMQTICNAATIDNEKPTVSFTTRSIYDLYHNLLTPQQRFVDSETASGGFKNLMFAGIPVIADSFCPASNLVFLNEDYLHLFYHSKENFRLDPFIKPVNQAAKTAKIFWAGAFGCNNPRLQGRLSAITG